MTLTRIFLAAGLLALAGCSKPEPTKGIAPTFQPPGWLSNPGRFQFENLQNSYLGFDTATGQVCFMFPKGHNFSKTGEDMDISQPTIPLCKDIQ
jgi:hypothetical protein